MVFHSYVYNICHHSHMYKRVSVTTSFVMSIRLAFSLVSAKFISVTCINLAYNSIVYNDALRITASLFPG